MRNTRKILKIRYGQKTGAITAFINADNISELDPFVLWDHFEAKEVLRTTGLDYHGHSGVDAVSYPVTGKLRHIDSSGNRVTLASGDLHIMTSGNGIIHKDTMTPQDGRVESFSLWTALPAGETEMAEASSINISSAQIPLVEEPDSTTKILIGSYKDSISPIQYSIAVTYLDIMISPYGIWQFEPDNNQTTGFIYVRSGNIYISGNQLHPHQMGTLHSSSLPLEIKTGSIGARFFVTLGEPLHQPLISSGNSIHSSAANLVLGEERIKQLMANRRR
ncbi:pirin family protein [Photobacterium sp. SDRW27]|uniref:pirin family protein n=1 Tax=Photobacterium obscurum TaxID=2829490 RepID=UPI002243C102|nr:pirin family protein [Photobacterium obscurum]MCW8331221.1 pirin family protein [Photobacterium obscurum]